MASNVGDDLLGDVSFSHVFGLEHDFLLFLQKTLQQNNPGGTKKRNVMIGAGLPWKPPIILL